ncbi:hypothetical protein F5887DRAFT_6241 [Amanita rubescens]|nr:hypothetical protein F5887DRAFT_6241 [Amanita rubescens]
MRVYLDVSFLPDCSGSTMAVVHRRSEGGTIHRLESRTFRSSFMYVYTSPSPYTLVQSIAPVNVSTTNSLIFTPNPKVGPNSGDYHIMLISENITYSSYSTLFTLKNMMG